MYTAASRGGGEFGVLCPDSICGNAGFGSRWNVVGDHFLVNIPSTSYFYDDPNFEGDEGSFAGVLSTGAHWADLGPIALFLYPTEQSSWLGTATRSFFRDFSVFGPANDPRPSCFGQFLSDTVSGFAGSFAPPSPSPGEIVGVTTAMLDYPNEVNIVATQHLAQYGSRISKYKIGAQAGQRAGLAGLLANLDFQEGVALYNEWGAAHSGQCK